MQNALFPDEDDAPALDARARPHEAPAALSAKAPRGRATAVQPCEHDEALHALAARLPPTLYLGGSSWSYPGWASLVWDREYSASKLSKQGLAAYAQHPLFRTVCVDRAFYRPLSVIEYANMAAQVPAHFRFVVKAPLVVTDATVRGEDGRGQQPNPMFLNPELAVREFVQPALDGLGSKLGALVFQLSPLPLPLLANLGDVFERLHTMLRALPALQPTAPEGLIAVEVRDPEFLTPEFARLLRDAGARYCLGLQAKMPPIAQQLPMLRAMWPGPLVCRWNLNPVNGAYGYEDAEKRYGPFDKLIDVDLDTREALARVIAGTTGAGQLAYVCISNHAEGSAPLTARALAELLVR
jgi:uncharacterized protein YecE (DUF72 family)